MLAEIDAPEVDQQLNQARAMLNQAQTSLALAKVTAPRYQELIKTNSVSQQEVDQNNQNLAAQEANVQAATAAVGRLDQMQSYEKILAPLGVEDPSIGTFSQTFASKGTILLEGVGGGAQDIIAGRRPMTDFDGLVQDWRTNGGNQIKDELAQSYAQLNHA